MVAEVFSGMIQGIEGQIVQIQADISNGLPNFYMTGYLSNEVKESKERVRTALHNIGIALPPKRISVNFAPADFRKCGTFFDLAGNICKEYIIYWRIIIEWTDSTDIRCIANRCFRCKEWNRSVYRCEREYRGGSICRSDGSC